MWFQSLTGFHEKSADQVRSNIVVDGETMISRVNDRKMICGRLETPTLGELRSRFRSDNSQKGSLRLFEVVGDVQKLRRQPENANALFQVASQFNLLEMVSPSITPEFGVDRYESDRTQGPACAIACGAGTIYRNYFAEVDGRIGQSEDRQIDCLREMGEALGNADDSLWAMRNGYALASADGLREISRRLATLDESGQDELRQSLRIGVQWNTEVTLGEAAHTVTQAYCSALPVAYSSHAVGLWADFAALVLEAAYEATICVAAMNLERTGSEKLFLTLLGGGAFGNRDDWIFAALERALRCHADVPLDVSIVSFGSSKSRVRKLVREWAG